MTPQTNTNFSNSRVLWQVVLLYITTCGLYFFYWFYKTNQELYRPFPDTIKPIWRTLGLLVPFLNIYLIWKLFSAIKKFADQAGVESYSYPSLFTVAFLFCSYLYNLRGLFSFFGFFSVLPVVLAQKTLNLYWKKQQPSLPEKTKLSTTEILICCVGGLVLVLAFIGAGLSSSA